MRKKMRTNEGCTAYFDPDAELENIFDRYNVSVDRVLPKRRHSDIKELTERIIADYLNSDTEVMVIASAYSEKYFSNHWNNTIFISEDRINEVCEQYVQDKHISRILVAVSFDKKDECVRYLGEHLCGFDYASLYYLMEKNGVCVNYDIMHLVMPLRGYPKGALIGGRLILSRIWSCVQYSAQYYGVLKSVMNELEWLSIKYDRLFRLRKYKYNGVGQELIARGMYKADPTTIIRLLNELEQIKREKNEKAREYLCRKVIHYFLIMRDFLSAYEYIDKFKSAGYIDESYLNLKEELNVLFDRMKTVVNKRKGDIVLNWIDDIPSERLSDLPFVSKKISEGIFIPNTFASLPFTTWVTRSIFSGEKPIEGRLFLRGKIGKSDKEYPLMNTLKRDGYELRYSAFRSRATKVYKKDYLTKLESFDESMLSSRSQWFGVCELCKNKKKVFLIIHTLFETHRPFASPWNTLENVTSILESKKTINRNYVDKEIEWYSRFYGRGSKCIWMSDHGDTHLYDEKQKKKISLEWYKDYATHCFIGCSGDGIPKCELTDFFTFDRFPQLYKFIINPEENTMERITCDEVRYESYDLYYDGSISNLLRMTYDERVKKRGEWMQFIGIRDRNYKYIRFKDNTELFYKLPDEETNLIDDASYSYVIDTMRKKVKDDDFIDVFKEKFFKKSRLLYCVEKTG